jgi:formate hydrogenlyase subunit 6/NADH:ubiquinone oxidoreductase subunit I
MKIVRLLWHNLRGGIATLRYPASPEVTEGFRGLVHFDPQRCTGCAMCRFRCTARAIAFTAAGKEFTWAYDPGQCTFCGRCVEGCKDHALSQDQECPPIYLDLGTLRRAYTLTRRTPLPKMQTPTSSTASSQGDAHGSE